MRSLETPAGTGMRKCVQRTRAGLLVPLALLLSTSCATGTVEAEDRVEAEAKEGGTGTRAEAGEAEEGTRATAAPSAPPARLVAPPARVVAPPAAPANPWIASKAQRGPKQQPNAPWGADLGESYGAEGLALAPPSTRSAQLQQARSFGMIGAMGANAGEAPPPAAGWRYAPPTDRDRYDHFEDNSFVRVGDDPRSTFSIDVDTASLALVRSHLTAGRTPPKGAVRIEELINYFEYSYAEPQANAPFSVTSEVASAPWAQARRLVRIGLKGKEIAMGKRPAEELYRAEHDPECMHNLAADPECADVKDELRTRMETELVEQSDPRLLGDAAVFDTYEYVGDSSHSWAAYVARTWQRPNY